jgi:hypothetical protein
MTEVLSSVGYEQTKEKLARLELRLAELAGHSELSADHRTEARQSYETMIAQYRRELKLYEASHPEAIPSR